MIVDDIRRSFADGMYEISARVRTERRGEMPRLHYRVPERFAGDRVDGSPFLAGLLLFALREREDVTVDAPVSPRLLGRLAEIMAVFDSFFPGEVRPVAVQAPEGEPPPPADLTASYFTRGVDSWFAVLTALEDDPQTPPLTRLVFCPDFLPTDRWPAQLVRDKTEGTRRAAAATGCEFVIVRTNQKQVYRGHQLVAVALALGVSRMLVPSGGMWGELHPRATHPDMDHLFSTERTEIVHYGAASRKQKVARVARSADALSSLHVCRFNRAGTDRNCGRCEKCLRTMVALHLCGRLDEAAPVFEAPLTPAAVARCSKEIKHPHQWEDLLHALDDSPEDRNLAAAVRLVILRAHLRNAYEKIDEYGHEPRLAEVRSDFPETVEYGFEVVRRVHRGLDPEAPPLGPVRRTLMSQAVLRTVPIRKADEETEDDDGFDR